MEEQHFNKKNTHTFKMPRYIQCSHEDLKCAPVFLNFGSFELYKQINKGANRFSVQQGSLQCLVCTAMNFWLMNMDIYIME